MLPDAEDHKSCGNAGKCAALTAELKEKDRIIEKFNADLAELQAKGLEENTVEVAGLRVASMLINNTNVDTLKKIADHMTAQIPQIVLVMGTLRDGKGTLVAACGTDAIAKGVAAGTVVREIAAVAGGKGGGRPNLAQAGVADPYKIDEALAQLPALVNKLVNK